MPGTAGKAAWAGPMGKAEAWLVFLGVFSGDVPWSLVLSIVVLHLRVEAFRVASELSGFLYVEWVPEKV